MPFPSSTRGKRKGGTAIARRLGQGCYTTRKKGGKEKEQTLPGLRRKRARRSVSREKPLEEKCSFPVVVSYQRKGRGKKDVWFELAAVQGDRATTYRPGKKGEENW